MVKSIWFKYGSDNPTREDIRRRLTGIRIEFEGSKPRIEGEVCILPWEGAIYPIDENRFVLKHTERIRQYERGYWVGSGDPKYGQQWLPASGARYLDDDDRFFLGPERHVPAGDRYKMEYFYGGEKHGTLFLNKIDDELTERLENDINSVIAELAE